MQVNFIFQHWENGMAARSGSIRSGRFKITNSTGASKEFLIIKSGSKSVYRFFNSGAKAFKVKVTSGITVEPKDSIDAEVTGELNVVVDGGDTIEGIYDFVEGNFDVRNGRYSGTFNNTKSPAIIHGREGSLYRIFNSGDDEFQLKYGKAGQSVTSVISKRQSHDFVVDGIVQLAVNGSADVEVKAIYDYLEQQKTIRSGRFTLGVADSPTVLHEIINFSKYSESQHLLYRIFNSGDHPIEIVAKKSLTSPTEEVLKTLESEQTFDIGLDKNGFSSKKVIWVRSTDATKPIDGIYEFLGFDD